MTDDKTALVIELGNVITKVALFDLGEGSSAAPRLIARGEAPTTGPEGGVSFALGAREALAEASEAAGRPLLNGDGGPAAAHTLIVSKAGGGVVVVVAGVVSDISALTAEKAALNGGATVADVFAVNDGRLPNQQRLAFRQSRLDLLLLAGGVDEGLLSQGQGTQVVTMAKNLSAALPSPRFDRSAPLPVVFAGSAEARDKVAEAFEGKAEFRVTDNVRPTMDEEKVDAAAAWVSRLFEEKVAALHPAYREVHGWADRSLPTGYALSSLVQAWGPKAGVGNVMLVDAGGSSVDIYSVIDGVFTRTGYDTSSLGLASGSAVDLEQLARWLPMALEGPALGNLIYNHRLRPAVVSLDRRERLVDMALRREELRGALAGHRRAASLLKGIRRRRHIGEVLGTYLTVGGQTTVDMSQIRTVVMTGGALAGPACTRAAAAMVILDGLQLAGLTTILADPQLTLAHYGALLAAGVVAAEQVDRDQAGLESLAFTVAPAPGQGGFWSRPGKVIANVTLTWNGGRQTARIRQGSLDRLAWPATAEGQEVTVNVRPAPGWDFGGGLGLPVAAQVAPTAAGVFLDGRPRPISLPAHPVRCREKMAEWLSAVGLGGDAE